MSQVTAGLKVRGIAVIAEDAQGNVAVLKTSNIDYASLEFTLDGGSLSSLSIHADTGSGEICSVWRADTTDEILAQIGSGPLGPRQIEQGMQEYADLRAAMGAD